MFNVVVHIDDVHQWQVVLNNVKNTIKGLQERPFKIVVMANGTAVQGYLTPEVRSQVTELKHPNLTFTACQNSLNGQNITPGMLNPIDIDSKIEIVPVAIIAIVDYQQEGFAYLKP